MKKLELKYYIAELIIIIIALVVIIISYQLNDGIIKSICGSISSALLVGGVWAIVQKHLISRDEENKLYKLFQIFSSIKESGLIDVMTDSKMYSFNDIIENSEHFYAIMNDGKRWIENNTPSLEIRFSKKDTKSEFYIVDPDSHFLKALANKTNYTEIELREKIDRAVASLKEAYERSSKKGDLKIFFLKNYPTHSLFYTDNRIIETPYQTSSGRSVVPLYIYEYIENKTSIGEHLYKDLNNVREESKLIFDSSSKEN